MAYFPNGTSGAIYEEEWCANCIHEGGEDGPGCPIMLIHNLFNYDQCDETPKGKAAEAILDLLIPRTKDDLGAEQCTMFRTKADAEAEEAELRRLAEQPRKYEQIMREMERAGGVCGAM